MKPLYESILNTDINHTNKIVKKTKHVNDTLYKMFKDLLKNASSAHGFGNDNFISVMIRFDNSKFDRIDIEQYIRNFYKNFQKIQKDFLEVYNIEDKAIFIDKPMPVHYDNGKKITINELDFTSKPLEYNMINYDYEGYIHIAMNKMDKYEFRVVTGCQIQEILRGVMHQLGLNK